MSAIWFELTAVLVLILLNGLFSMSEMAIVSARRARLEHLASTGNSRARTALELSNQPNQLLSTVQVGITLVGILTGAFGSSTPAAALAQRLREVPLLAPYADPLALGLVVLGITYLTLIVGELVPKRLALNNPEGIAVSIAVPMRTLSKVVAPFVLLLGASTDFVLRLLGVQPNQEAPVTEEEVRVLVAQGTRAGVFEAAEQDLVDSVFRLGDLTAGELMQPRPDVTWLDLNDPPEAIREEVLASHHSRFPVCDGDFDRVLGIVTAKDILAHGLLHLPTGLGSLVREATFIPETLPVFRAIEQLRTAKAALGIVVDEFGSSVGIISVMDILESLVGDLPTPGQEEEPLVFQRDDGSWLLDGRLPVSELKTLLGIRELPDEDEGEYRTLGGLVMRQLGRIPSTGDRFDLDDLCLEVMDMDGRRVDKVLATRAGRRE
ncbi:MAG: HlyC/CorC family transporter [Chloroflexi bacterium]|nr:HlyC/CorC family transporter [Chloroflexota bacterium]